MLVPIKIMVEELRGMRHRSRKHKSKSHIAPEGCLPHHHPPTSVSSAPVKVVDCDDDEEQRSLWVHLPPELLLDIINRVESAEKSWPARRDVVACAAVCRSWRDMVSEIVKTPQQCGLLTFPISLKQPGPREHPIQCFIRRDRSCSTYRLYLGLSPALSGEESKIILTAKKIRRATCLDFIISLVPHDFSRASSNYVGKLRSNFLGTKFTVFDSQPPLITTLLPPSKRTAHQWVHSRRMAPTVTPGSYPVATIQYELNVLRTRGPRRMNCMMHSIPMASLHEGGTAPTPTAFTRCTGNCHPAQLSSVPTTSSENSLSINNSSESQLEGSEPVNGSQDPLVIKNKAPRWHEQLQCWCLNFKGRVTVASVKNFQLVASAVSDHDISVVEQEKVILQFGKIGKDIFTMDYRYPLSAFQAFAICLSSFDTKPACE